MTEHIAKYTRRTVSLPTARGLDLLVGWINEGPASLAPGSRGNGAYDPRARSMAILRRVAMGLEVPPHESGELERKHGRDFSALSDTLLNSLAWRARARGYLMPGGRERTPLTPVQADTLYRVAWGSSYEDIAKDTGTAPTAASGNMKRMREAHSCATTAHLVACAFRSHWLPDQEELRVLLSGRMVWDAKGAIGKAAYHWGNDS